jgi:hypothetical protein
VVEQSDWRQFGQSHRHDSLPERDAGSGASRHLVASVGAERLARQRGSLPSPSDGGEPSSCTDTNERRHAVSPWRVRRGDTLTTRHDTRRGTTRRSTRCYEVRRRGTTLTSDDETRTRHEAHDERCATLTTRGTRRRTTRRRA